jgi:hypothetical protein
MVIYIVAISSARGCSMLLVLLFLESPIVFWCQVKRLLQKSKYTTISLFDAQFKNK